MPRSASLGATLAACVLATLCTAPALGAGPTCDVALSSRIPARRGDAVGGRAFLERIRHLDEDAREAAIRAELLAGNVPTLLRALQPVRFASVDAQGAQVVTLCVAPDYLSVGTDDDHVLVPMRLATALDVAERFGFVLPTSRMVDGIYDQASVRLAPRPLPPTDQMRSTAWLERHDRLVREQLADAGATPGALVAGHKKDLVLTNALERLFDRVAIYGWHRGPRAPIQPLSLWHGYRYADYSHGVRLVSATAMVDASTRPVADVLADPRLAPAVSAEGIVSRLTELVRRLRHPHA